MERLKKRRQFLTVAKGRRVHTGLFSLQAIDRGDDAPARAGFTVTKKVGHATERNRVRRRLKEALRLAGGVLEKPGHDYVIVGRREVLGARFSEVCAEIATAFNRMNRPRDGRPAGKPPRLH